MKRPYLSIRSKLVISILLILLVSYSTLLYTTVANFDAFLEKEVSKNLEAGLNFARGHYFSRADQIKLALMQPASSPYVQDHLRQRNRFWLKSAMERWQTALPFIDIMAIVDPRQKVVVRLGSDQSGATLPLPHILERAFREGKAVIATELVPDRFLNLGGVGSGHGALAAGGEVMLITIAIPIITPAGELLGGIVAGDIINMDPHYPLQVQKIFGREAELTITQKGRKIASSLKGDADFPATLAPEILASLGRGNPYRGEARIGAKVYMTAFEPISDSRGEVVGSLSVALSKENYQKIRRDNEYNILVSAVVGILLSFGIAYLVTRHITRPLKALSRGVRKIEEGDLNQRVLVPTGDELGMLADSFNRMASALAERDGTIKKKNQALQELNELLEKKVAERTAELRMEMERLETVLTSMAEGIVVTDRDNRVILFNPAAQRLFDLVPHRVVNQPVEKLCELAGFCGIAEYLAAVRSGGVAAAAREQELEVQGKKLKVSLSPLLDEAETLAGVVMSIRDVTMEEAVDRMKTEFISTVSHELKTPLTSMKGSLQFILSKGKWLTDTERELLSVCLRNTDRLIRLISDILDISKIEEGRVELNFRPQAIGPLVSYAIEEIKPLAMGRNITIISEIGDDIPPVYGDYDRLVQVVTNLLSNAVKFSPNGKVITVAVAREGNYVAVSVADRGAVIQWSDRDKLFKKFQRLEMSETGERGGTGLGLAICKEIVERHHGRIYYQTGITGGNVFTFTVPVFEEQHGPG
ncbi:MAG: ATP-binding protein [Geobacteraceae bacterium]|nr:ATP-binding protein [Geobacteraceae bacterium]